MTSHSFTRKWRYVIVGLIGVATIVGALEYRAAYLRGKIEESLNYKISYPGAPAGWKPVRHGPLTLFAYQQTGSKLLISGSVNQMIEEYNPTPDMHTDELAKMWVDITLENMPGWKAEELGTVKGNGVSFRMIRRSEKKHEVVTAFGVRGNTTVLITLSGRDQHVVDVEREMGDFQGFLANCRLTKTDLSKL